MKQPKKKASSFKQITDSIYNGAWNNLALHQDSKKTLAIGGALIGFGIIGAFILSKGKKF